MSIASKLIKLETDISNAYDGIEIKEGTIPLNKNTENLKNAILSIPSGSKPNIFIQDTQPETYDGIWIADSNYENYPVVEVDNEGSTIANSINILKGNRYNTILFDYSTNFYYQFYNVVITDNNNYLDFDVDIYYGDGNQWNILPKNYIPLTYIQSTRTQWIDTGIIGKSGIRCETEFELVSQTGDDSILGSRNGNNRFYMLCNYPSNKFFIGYGGNVNSFGTLNLNTKYKYYCSLNVGSQIVEVDDVELYSNTISSLINTNYNMYIFSCNMNNTAGENSSAKLYYLKIWEENSLVRDFIPVKDSNNVACLYDKVSKTFFYNAGTGSFIAGPEI